MVKFVGFESGYGRFGIPPFHRYSFLIGVHKSTSSWWLQMSWCQICDKPLTITMLIDFAHCRMARVIITQFIMMMSSNGNIFRVTGHLWGNSPVPGEFPAQWPVTRSFDVFFDLRLNTQLSKQSWGTWFETLSHPLWRHCNDRVTIIKQTTATTLDEMFYLSLAESNSVCCQG